METKANERIEDLLHHELYRPEQVAELLTIAEDVIRHAVYSGDLPATVVGHDIVAIRRADLLRWLEERETA